MSGLKPCPFCGGEAHVKEVVSACETLYTVGCSDSEWMGYETWLLKPTKEEAIAAWNRRAERTCHLVYYDDGDGYPPNVQCSACGGWLDEYASPDYCPNCGARVVDE